MTISLGENNTTFSSDDRTLPAYVAVEGPIGIGKTTLTKRLADSFNYQILLEQPEQNPFLDRFYANPKQAALATQLFFLFQRVEQIQNLRQADIFEPVRVADFLIAKDKLFAEITLDQDELKLYETVYEKMTMDAPTPDLVIYLQAPVDTLLQRIQQRGIASEQHITRDYLTRINEAYSKFFFDYNDSPLLIVNATDIDLANNDRDYKQLVDYLLNIRSGRHYFNPSLF